jgi:hypothetical protein
MKRSLPRATDSWSRRCRRHGPGRVCPAHALRPLSDNRILIKERDLRMIQALTPARLALSAVMIAAAAPAVSAQQPGEQTAEQQREHVVRRGDTLWDLARAYLADPFRWPLIFEANQSLVRDPHWIYPAQRLIIPPVLHRSLHAEPVTGQPVLPQLHQVMAVAVAQEPPTVVSTLDLRRPVVSLAEYLSVPWLLPPSAAVPAARILRSADPAVTENRLPPMLHPNDRVQVDVSPGMVLVGDSLVVVRSGRRIGTWGQVMEPLAVLRVDSVAQGAVMARIVGQFGDARVGDLVLPLGAVPHLPAGDPERVQDGLHGQLLEFLITEPLHGTTELAFISLGSADGIGIGDELAVYVPAVERAPATQVATVRVVRVDERTATVRVVSVTSTALRDGLPVRLISRMR